MKFMILLGIIFYQIIISVSQNDTQCIENPTGEITLNVRGVPGPEGPQGPKGDIGRRGRKGLKGDRGVHGEKGDHGVIGPRGLKGTKGDGHKGQKGATGPEGKLGPQGSRGLMGPRGSRGPPGHEGPEGPIGLPGNVGLPGPRGLQGEPGDTFLNDEELDRVTTSLHNSILGNVSTTVYEAIDTVLSELKAMNETLNILYSEFNSKCGIFANWKRIAYFDTTRGDSCPTGLRTVTSNITDQTACGRTANRGCTSLQFSPNGKYTDVCGRVRGYQYYQPEAFNTGTNSIDSHYLHGVSITHGTPRTHIWSYVAGLTERYSYTDSRCPCARPYPTDRSDVPLFVGEDFYCESGFSGNHPENRIAWEDPLWDGQGCFASGNQCCNRYGWFHREIPTTSDNIEVRWCADAPYTTNEDVLTDQLEIWVM